MINLKKKPKRQGFDEAIEKAAIYIEKGNIMEGAETFIKGYLQSGMNIEELIKIAKKQKIRM